MKYSGRFLAIILWIFLGFGCSATVEPEEISGEIVFLVESDKGAIIQHARIVVISEGRGVVVLAEPDDEGLLTASIAEVRRHSNGALLACAEGYYCGGWLLDDLQIKALSADKGAEIVNITLTPIRLL